MNTNLQPQVGVVTIVIDPESRKILLGKRLKPIGKDMWSLPGGHLEMYESFEDCASRETMEEAGITLSNIKFLAARNNVYPAHDKHYITIIMISQWAGGVPHVPEAEKEKCQEWQWFDLDNLPDPLFEVGVLFSDVSFLTKIWSYIFYAGKGIWGDTEQMTVKEAAERFKKWRRGLYEGKP